MSATFPIPVIGHSAQLYLPAQLHLPRSLLSQLSWPIKYSPLRTLYLFTKSDIKTILFPVTVFAYLTASSTSVDRLALASFWLWLHLLQFCVSNQSMDPKEDALNKPWRPIPAGRISVPAARVLRWALLPFCFALSVLLNVEWQGIALATAFIAHNELGLDSHWFVRNLCNAWGYAAFNAGTAAIACSVQGEALDPRTLTSFICNAFIILTTIHAQDFRDEVGDKLLGRRTLPIVWPEASRVAIVVTMVAWSIGLSIACELKLHVAGALCALAVFVGIRFYYERTAEADGRSYLYYNLWLATAQVVHIPVIMAAFS
ncbi:hypothetical protein FA95DRAFT_1601807 [Auriscalpium vulgare]|uniref:Uncharacterized protein n=1 Tax=Auriscalpium vulgare TaxID=40419 RepID=A0ACB8S981_9AGAM|nr:hypothetical protein FA95DRAFT_1601807 [Auriscalpium vulgare]